MNLPEDVHVQVLATILATCGAVLALQLRRRRAKRNLDIRAATVRIRRNGPKVGRGKRGGPLFGWRGVRASDRQGLWDILNSLHDGPYYTNLRMCKRTFHELAKVLSAHEVFQAHGTIPMASVEEQLCTTLYYFAKGLTYHGTTMALGLPEGTFRNFIRRTTAALVSLYPSLVQFPCTTQEMQTASRDFWEIHKIPGCIGIIDGTHFPSIRKENEYDPAQFYHYKEGHSLGAQLVCDARGFITYSFVGYPGRAHDSAALAASCLYAQRLQMMDNRKYLIADAGYALTPWCLTPFRETEAETSTRNRCYNKFLCGRRCLIERVIGHLKGRWRILRHVSETVDPSTHKDIISACIVLHNFCLRAHDVDKRYGWSRDPDPRPIVPPILRQQAANEQTDARRLRDAHIELFNRPEWIAFREDLRGTGRTLL